ncbi:MAG: Clp protease N-terminal domain-containing protein, partial [Pseudomonadota bacterium]|nr:Clp protease N-terminal domain-containing protein [Pseudomonadota bacterium]
MFSQNLEQSLHQALDFARSRNHEYATLEHLLMALIDDPDARDCLCASGVDLMTLAARLVTYIDEELTSLIVPGSDCSRPTAGFQRVLQRAVIHVQSLEHD